MMSYEKLITGYLQRDLVIFKYFIRNISGLFDIHSIFKLNVTLSNLLPLPIS
jgi:hypothetical protein